MSYRKSADEIAVMRQSGLLTWQAHQEAARCIKPGVTTREIDAAVESFLLAHGAAPLFKGVPGVVPFPATTCISVNDEIVHGIPGPRVLVDGDIVSVDIGCRWQGWCSDAAMTHPVGSISAKRSRLLKATEGALRLALKQMRPGVRWSAIARQMEHYVQAAQCTMVRAPISGHGIGRELWESPSVPNFVTPDFLRRGDFTLQAGMVIAVEPMVALGAARAVTQPDHWTIVSADGSATAHFEHTVALTDTGIQVLTTGPEGQGWAM